MSPPSDDETILDELKDRRKNIILSLYRHGELGAGELRSITGTPRGSKEHHYEKLQEWGLMDHVGHQQSRGGNPERLFALTDYGTRFVEDYLVDTDEAPDAYAVKIDRALDEIGKLRGTVEELERTVEQQDDEIEELREEKADVSARLDELVEELNGGYVDRVADVVEERLSD